jgi:hypothetical protein
MPCWHWWVFAVLLVLLGGGKTNQSTLMAQHPLLQPLRPVRLVQVLQVLQVQPRAALRQDLQP